MTDDDGYEEMPQFLLGALRRQHREETNMDATNDAGIGHNRGVIDDAREAMNTLSFYLRENPVISSPEEARAANEVLTSSERTLRDMEDQRKEEAEPFYTRYKAINAVYSAVRVPFEHAIGELKRRLTNYVAAEERKRAAEAARLRALAEEAEQKAREAERKEKDAIASVDVGACEDVGSAIEDAEAAFGEFCEAERAATIAERDTPVRLTSRFGGRARTMRTTETLSVTDAAAAIGALGLTPKIADAIVSEARVYRKAHGKLPPGISVQYVRSM